MDTNNLMVAGRRLRTKAEYQAALRDEQKIKEIRKRYDFHNKEDVLKLYGELRAGSFSFESAVGDDFDNKIFDMVEKIGGSQTVGSNAQTVAGNKAVRGNAQAVAGNKAVRGNAQAVAGNNKAVRGNTQAVAGSNKAVRGNAQAVAGNNKAVRGNTQAVAGSNKAVRGNAQAVAGNGKTAYGNGRTGTQETPDSVDADMQREILEVFRKKEKRRKWIALGCGILAIASFTCFGIYYFFTARTDRDLKNLAGLKNNRTFAGMPLGPVEVHKTGDVELPDVLEEYKSLYNKNKKLIGWLKIDDTIIDHPVMQTANNEYYLDHNFKQEYDKNGSIFMDFQCVLYPRSTNLIVYGHHMKSGKMFGQLQYYAKESYYKGHPVIQFDTIYEKGTYQIMYVFRSKIYNENEIVFKYYQFIDANSEEEFQSNMKEMAQISLYDTGVTASYGDQLLTLSTCDDSQSGGRFVVVAKRVS